MLAVSNNAMRANAIIVAAASSKQLYFRLSFVRKRNSYRIKIYIIKLIQINAIIILYIESIIFLERFYFKFQ